MTTEAAASQYLAEHAAINAPELEAQRAGGAL